MPPWKPGGGGGVRRFMKNQPAPMIRRIAMTPKTMATIVAGEV